MRTSEPTREELIKLDDILSDEKLASMRDIAMAIAENDPVFAAALLSASAGYVAGEKVDVSPLTREIASVASFKLGMMARGCQCPKCLAKKATAEMSANDVLKRAAGK